MSRSVVDKIISGGVIPIIRIDSGETAKRIADAILHSGIYCLEVTLTTPGALDVISELRVEYGDDFCIGAGTVLDSESARAAIAAGAMFIVSPNTRRETTELCRRYGVASCPGALTPSEVVSAWEQGADLVKVFPIDNVGGPAYTVALRAPLPQINLVPTGGVDLSNVGDHIRAGAAAVGVGSSLVAGKLVAAGDYKGIGTLAKRFAAEVAKARA